MNENLGYEDGHYEEFDDGGGRMPSWLSESPYWLIAVLVHVVALFIFGTIVVLEVQEKKKEKKTIVRQEFKREEYDPTKKRDLERKPEILQKEKENPILKIKPDKVSKKPKGTDLKNKTNKNLMQNSVNDAFGTSGAGAGAYGNRFGRGSLDREGGSEATESAVLAALWWLKRHQNEDGSWSSNGFLRVCDKEKYGSECQHKDASKAYEETGEGFEGNDVGVTALAMLAYLGFAHTHRDGEITEFRQVMKKAMKWMLKQQVKSSDPTLDGLYGAPVESLDEWIYNHSIATMAMSELLLLSRDKIKLQKSVEKASRWIIRAQNPGYGWKYGYITGKNDTSVTGWMVLALKTAKACSISRFIKIKKDEFQPAFEGALAWFESATSSVNGITGYEGPGDEGSRLQKHYPEDYPFSKKLSCMTAVGVLCRIFSGQSRRHDAIKQGVGILMDEVPTWQPATGKRQSKINLYYWYYATYALFQFGGTKWKEWKSAMVDALVPTQRVGGCEDGSWDPIGEWGIAGGRVYSTAIGAMTLEVYYRFKREQE